MASSRRSYVATSPRHRQARGRSTRCRRNEQPRCCHGRCRRWLRDLGHPPETVLARRPADRTHRGTAAAVRHAVRSRAPPLRPAPAVQRDRPAALGRTTSSPVVAGSSQRGRSVTASGNATASWSRSVSASWSARTACSAVGSATTTSCTSVPVAHAGIAGSWRPLPASGDDHEDCSASASSAAPAGTAAARPAASSSSRSGGNGDGLRRRSSQAPRHQQQYRQPQPVPRCRRITGTRRLRQGAAQRPGRCPSSRSATAAVPSASPDRPRAASARRSRHRGGDVLTRLAQLFVAQHVTLAAGSCAGGCARVRGV